MFFFVFKGCFGQKQFKHLLKKSNITKQNNYVNIWIPQQLISENVICDWDHHFVGICNENSIYCLSSELNI